MFCRIPFICKFKPGVPGLPAPAEDDYDDDYLDSDTNSASVDMVGEEMYNLKVQLVSDNDEKRATLLETRTDSATVSGKYLLCLNSYLIVMAGGSRRQDLHQ